jgi:peptidoglycan/LPS O-acetylase OafA/YrhL
MRADGSERLHGLDAVRGLALVLGVALHAAMSFMPGQQIWIVKDASSSEALGVFFFVTHMFRMMVFFVIGGFFARMLLEKRGPAGFVANRATRIALPLVVFWPILLAAIIAVTIWAAVQANGGALPTNAPPPPAPTLETLPLTHLWFLYLLLIFYAAALGVAGVAKLVDWNGGLRRALDAPVRWIAGSPLAPVLLAIPAAIAFWIEPEWRLWFGVITPDTGLVPNSMALTAFGAAFATGWLAQRQPVILARWSAWSPAFLIAAAALSVACLAYVGATPVIAPAAHDRARLIFGAGYAVTAWCWTLGLIGAGVRWFSNHSPARRWIADSSYWLYIIHLPIVMALQVVVAQLASPWWIKYPLVLVAAFTLMFASYQLLVRHSFVGRILNGRRPRGRDAPAPPLVSPAPLGGDTL